MLGRYGGETWFRVGDRDLATHVYRTFPAGAGPAAERGHRSPLPRPWGVRVAVWPMSDEPVRTIVDTEEGPLPFQEYFVRRGCQPRVRGFRWEGLERARLAPEARAALEQADLVVIAPLESVCQHRPDPGPPGRSGALEGADGGGPSRRSSGGRALKGPAAKMMAELGEAPSALAVARRYQAFLDGFVLDRTDAALAPAVAAMGIRPLVTGILILDPAARLRLAEEILQWVASWA
jgi:LPPG:FO 2-phospho-L-lactate transferase